MPELTVEVRPSMESGVAKGTSVRVIQITDSHLRKEPDGRLLGMNTRESLAAVVDLLKKQVTPPDLVLATGDLAQDGSAEAYRCFERNLSQFTCPVLFFPGNHDDPAVMTATVKRPGAFAKVWLGECWKIICLDSSVRGKVHGAITHSDLVFLQNELEADQDKHVAICFHHHPVPINSVWLDNIGLANAEQFFGIVDRFSHIRLILWGHIHQAFDQVRNNVRLLASPSTCVQFKPGSADFSVDDLAPGYRWLELLADGSVKTGIERIENTDLNVDLASKGYR